MGFIFLRHPFELNKDQKEKGATGCERTCHDISEPTLPLTALVSISFGPCCLLELVGLAWGQIWDQLIIEIIAIIEI